VDALPDVYIMLEIKYDDDDDDDIMAVANSVPSNAEKFLNKKQHCLSDAATIHTTNIPETASFACKHN